MRDVSAYPGFQAWWKERRHWFSERFQSFIESQFTDNPPRIYETWKAEA